MRDMPVAGAQTGGVKMTRAIVIIIRKPLYSTLALLPLLALGCRYLAENWARSV